MNDALELNRIKENLNTELLQLGKIRDRGKPELQPTIEYLGQAVMAINNLTPIEDNPRVYECTHDSCEWYYNHDCELGNDRLDCALIREEKANGD